MYFQFRRMHNAWRSLSNVEQPTPYTLQIQSSFNVWILCLFWVFLFLLCEILSYYHFSRVQIRRLIIRATCLRILNFFSTKNGFDCLFHNIIVMYIPRITLYYGSKKEWCWFLFWINGMNLECSEECWKI